MTQLDRMRELHCRPIASADELRGYWVVYVGKEVTIYGGPFPDYDTAAKEADRAGKKLNYVSYSVKYGTRDEVKEL